MSVPIITIVASPAGCSKTTWIYQQMQSTASGKNVIYQRGLLGCCRQGDSWELSPQFKSRATTFIGFKTRTPHEWWTVFQVGSQSPSDSSPCPLVPLSLSSIQSWYWEYSHA